jgi:Ca2+-binding EF-hand superfamily protein
MKKMTSPVVAAVMTVAFVLSAPTLAENMPVFSDCDLNADGGITESEFLKARSERIAKRAEEGRRMKNVANAPSFQDIDIDGDGTVNSDEFAAHQAAHRAKHKAKKKS